MNIKTVGFVGLARTTFDVALAAQVSASARTKLAELCAKVVGDDSLLTDSQSAKVAARRALRDGAEALVVAQLTFADASAVCEIAAECPVPIVLWAFPEERTGGRLRLNSLCGINLAAHALGKRNRAFGHVHCAPEALTVAQLQSAFAEAETIPETETLPTPTVDDDARNKARAVLDSLNGSLFARVGIPPEGFDTCECDAAFLRKTFGAKVRQAELSELFSAASGIDSAEVERLRDSERAALADFDKTDPVATEKTLRLRAALRRFADDEQWSGAAVRCWPEMFTEYGGACCGAMSALGGEGLPCACEADMNGAVTSRLLQELAGAPAFLADWVDCAPDGTAAFWHCGLAPLQMAGDAPRATIHSNRKAPLLREFALKAGVATVARLTTARNRPALAACRAEVVNAPRPFGGTCGVLKFARPAGEVFGRVVRSGMEHHFAIVYGDVAAECAAVAEECGLPFVSLCGEGS